VCVGEPQLCGLAGDSKAWDHIRNVSLLKRDPASAVHPPRSVRGDASSAGPSGTGCCGGYIVLGY